MMGFGWVVLPMVLCAAVRCDLVRSGCCGKLRWSVVSFSLVEQGGDVWVRLGPVEFGSLGLGPVGFGIVGFGCFGKVRPSLVMFCAVRLLW